MKLLPLPAPAIAARAAPPSPRGALASLSMAMLLPSLGTSIANVGLPTLARHFGAPFQAVQWVVLAYLLAVTTAIVGVGRLGDAIGRRRLLLAGIGLFTLASALCGLAPGLGLLIAARAVQGLGAAVMMALTLAFVGEAVPRHRTGSAMGLLGSMSAVGTALGPALGGALIGAFDWPALFFVGVPLGLVTLALAWRFLPADPPRAGNTRFDPAGTVVLALTLAAYALTMTLGRGHFGGLNALLLAAALGGAGLFVRVEGKVAAPLLSPALFRNPVLGAGFAMSALVTAVVMATLVVGPFYLHGALGLDAAGVGLAMSCGPVVAAMAGVPAGRLVDRVGAGRVVIGGLVGMAVGCVALAVLPAGLGVPGYVLPLAVVTAGYALFQAANNTAVMTDIAADRRGVVSGVLNLSRNLGLITGASVLGAVFALGSGSEDVAAAPADAVVAGMHVSFGVATALVLIALIVAARYRPSQGRRAP
ncbi:MFS transporter [Derxia lacustris]|uniref:MFS transporter n=1 Tax=Derxia lacustris TaxID=764842 RepID=UPI000A174E8B|nr:MFS transporter [Derxia lacustris]